MKKQFRLIQSLFLCFLLPSFMEFTPVKANDETNNSVVEAETVNKGIETETLEVKDDVLVVTEVLDSLFEDGYSQVTEAVKVEMPDEETTKYVIENLTIETTLDLEAVGEQTCTVTVYDQGSSNVADFLYLETHETEPIEKMEKNVKHTFDVTLTMEDTLAPVITLVDEEVEIEYEGDADPSQWFVSVVDNADGENVEYTVEGSVDTSAPGSYTLTYVAVDSNGNEARKDLIVNVAEAPVVTRMVYAYSANTSGSIYEMIELINATRASYGLHALSLDTGALGTAAQVRAAEASTYVSHYRPNGTSYKTALDEAGAYYNDAAEILTYAGTTAQSGLNWWMSSPAHRSYILSSTHTSIGIGYYNGMWAAILVN